MFTRRKITLFVILAIAFFLFVVAFEPKEVESQAVEVVSESATPNSERKIQITAAQNVAKANNPYSTNLSDCERFIKGKQKYEGKWARDEYETWGEYLEQGYTLDEITLVIEHFLNSNFSASFRVKQLRANSELGAQTELLNEELKNYVPKIFKNTNFRFLIKIPSATFDNYLSLSSEEKQTVLFDSPPSIDDIAYFITQKDFADAEILALISATSNPEAIVGYDKLEATSILDYAINASRLLVVEHLLNIGVVPTSDKYLGSSMEWALSRLMGKSKPEDVADAVKIIKLLKNKGAKARFETKSLLKVTGYFPRRYYDFDDNRIEHLITEYDLDLTTIETEYPLTFNENYDLLITKLKEKRRKYILEQFELRDIDAHLSSCEVIQKEVATKWRPRAPQKILDELTERNIDEGANIEVILADIDPFLVDFYRVEHDGYFRKQIYVDVPNNVFHPLKEGKLTQVIDYFLSLDLTNPNKNWLFSQILPWNISFYDELASSDLMVEEIEYLDLKTHNFLHLSKIQELNETSYDLFGQDIRNKTLLYYAVRNGSLELIMYLQEENAPFIVTPFGEDPLHVALNESRYLESFNKNIIPIVDVLMRYSPEIDKFHLQRMVVLKMTAPQIYEELVTRHPQLAVNTDTPLPQVR